MRKKQNGGWKVSDADWFYFSFYDPSWSESNFILFLFFLFSSSWSDPDWWSDLIRFDVCTCLAKMFVCPVPKISNVMINGAAELHISVDLHCGITAAAKLHNSVDLLCGTYGRLATQLSRFTLWHNRRWASQLAGKFTLWHNGRRAKQPGLMHAPGVARIFQRKIWRLNPK